MEIQIEFGQTQNTKAKVEGTRGFLYSREYISHTQTAQNYTSYTPGS